jgi:hypothetical protein
MGGSQPKQITRDKADSDFSVERDCLRKFMTSGLPMPATCLMLATTQVLSKQMWRRLQENKRPTPVGHGRGIPIQLKKLIL